MNELLAMKKPVYELSAEWREAFGEPERNGVWFVWGRSGSGKTSFVLQLCKELCRFGKVAYDSLEEGASISMKNAFIRAGMQDVARRLVLLDNENMEELDKRLSRKKSPDTVVIDSYQYTGMSFEDYLAFKRRHRNKLIVIISQADGTRPKGRTAGRVMFDAARCRRAGFSARKVITRYGRSAPRSIGQRIDRPAGTACPEVVPQGLQPRERQVRP